MDSNLLKTKSIEQLVGDVEHGGKALKRSLSAWDLTLLGIGAIIGTGHLRADRHGRGQPGGPGDHAVATWPPASRARSPRSATPSSRR